MDPIDRDVNKLQEDYQRTLQDAVSKLDKEYMRQMQIDFFKCGIKCCEDQNSPLQDVHRCIERCEQPLTQAHNFVQSEMSTFQNRVQQCSSECANKARDGLKENATDEQLKAAQQEAFKCAKNCVDTQLSNGLPALISRIQSQLKKLKAEQMRL